MSNTSESPQGPRTLPRPELNPLLNPVLAENMGRWAEVYFTSPPEKREEAVLGLLRELEAGKSARESSAPRPQTGPNPAALTFLPTEETLRSSNQPIQAAMAPCGRCGHDNPVNHQFCGMCGYTLSAADPGEFRTDSPYEHHTGEMESAEPGPVPEPPEAPPESNVDESRRDEPREVVFTSDPYDLSMLKGLRERGIDDYEYEEQSSPRYRYYFGAVLAIVLLVLGYIAWHGGRASQNSHQISPAPPPATAENTPAASSSTPAPTAVAAHPAKTSAPAHSTSSENRAAQLPQPETTTHTAPGPSQNPLATAAPTQASAAQSQPGHGSNGQTRDSAEAEAKLWSEVKKHNGLATLQLADLYLKGDGVSKNCEQARILLDAAAQRGIQGAGERLKNLQAFGCQ